MVLETVPDEGLLLVLAALVLSGPCLCYAIAADASARGANGLSWGLFAFVVLPLAVPGYLVYRRRLPSRTAPPERVEQVLGAYGIGGFAAILLATVLTPPDPFALLLYGPALLVVLVPAAFVLCYDPGWRALSA